MVVTFTRVYVFIRYITLGKHLEKVLLSVVKRSSFIVSLRFLIEIIIIVTLRVTEILVTRGRNEVVRISLLHCTSV